MYPNMLTFYLFIIFTQKVYLLTCNLQTSWIKSIYYEYYNNPLICVTVTIYCVAQSLSNCCNSWVRYHCARFCPPDTQKSRDYFCPYHYFSKWAMPVCAHATTFLNSLTLLGFLKIEGSEIGRPYLVYLVDV